MHKQLQKQKSVTSPFILHLESYMASLKSKEKKQWLFECILEWILLVCPLLRLAEKTKNFLLKVYFWSATICV